MAQVITGRQKRDIWYLLTAWFLKVARGPAKHYIDPRRLALPDKVYPGMLSDAISEFLTTYN